MEGIKHGQLNSFTLTEQDLSRIGFSRGVDFLKSLHNGSLKSLNYQIYVIALQEFQRIRVLKTI